jgi:hypothetical protein
MSKKEQRVWQYVLANRKADVKEIAEACGVEPDFVGELLTKIGTPESVWRYAPNNSLTHQEGGSHYKNMTVQPWEALEAWLTPEEYRGYHKGVAVAYLAREQQKGGDEDIKKAVHHLQRLIEVLSEER